MPYPREGRIDEQMDVACSDLEHELQIHLRDVRRLWAVVVSHGESSWVYSLTLTIPVILLFAGVFCQTIFSMSVPLPWWGVQLAVGVAGLVVYLSDVLGRVLAARREIRELRRLWPRMAILAGLRPDALRIMVENDPRFARMEGAQEPRWIAEDRRAPRSLVARFRSLLLRMPNMLLICVGVWLGQLGFASLGGRDFSLEVGVLCGVGLGVSGLYSLRRFRHFISPQVNSLQEMLLRSGLFLSAITIWQMCQAYAGSDQRRIAFWTRRAVLEAVGDALPSYERGEVIEQTLRPIWDEWWGRDLPPGAEEAFAELRSPGS